MDLQRCIWGLGGIEKLSSRDADHLRDIDYTAEEYSMSVTFAPAASDHPLTYSLETTQVNGAAQVVGPVNL